MPGGIYLSAPEAILVIAKQNCSPQYIVCTCWQGSSKEPLVGANNTPNMSKTYIFLTLFSLFAKLFSVIKSILLRKNIYKLFSIISLLYNQHLFTTIFFLYTLAKSILRFEAKNPLQEQLMYTKSVKNLHSSDTVEFICKSLDQRKQSVNYLCQLQSFHDQMVARACHSIAPFQRNVPALHIWTS